MTKDHDLIYRREALEVIETSADLIRRSLDYTDLVGAERDKFEWGLGLIEPLIYDMESLPSVDAAPVVRCKDCKWHRFDKDNIPYCYNIDYGYGWKDDEFCSRGERKERNGNG